MVAARSGMRRLVHPQVCAESLKCRSSGFCLELTVQNYVNRPKLSGAGANISAAGTVLKMAPIWAYWNADRETDFFLEWHIRICAQMKPKSLK